MVVSPCASTQSGLTCSIVASSADKSRAVKARQALIRLHDAQLHVRHDTEQIEYLVEQLTVLARSSRRPNAVRRRRTEAGE